jgi:DinB family protein
MKRKGVKKSPDHDRSLRRHIVYLLKGGGAHLDFDAAVRGLPPGLRGARVPGLPHTAWQLLEHLRIAQWDIVEFSRSARHVSPEFSKGYWPDSEAPPDETAWEKSVGKFQSDLRSMVKLVKSPRTDLLAKIPWGDGQTILREALLVADHNAYHIGQLVLLRRALGAWPKD